MADGKTTKTRRIQGTETALFNVHAPEGGRWWHALSPEGRQVFEDVEGAAEFGKPTVETTGTPFQGRRMVRFRPAISELAPWLEFECGGGVLALDPTLLREGQNYIIVGWCGDIHVVGDVVHSRAVLYTSMPDPDAAGVIV